MPTVRVAPEKMHPDIYSQWKMLQWDPPEFARAPGGPPSNVAISHVRLGGRAAFIGKVGSDEFGEQLMLMMNNEKVQTRGLKLEDKARTACSFMKIKFEEGKMRAEMVKECPEDSLIASELNLSVLKEVNKCDFFLGCDMILMMSCLYFSWSDDVLGFEDEFYFPILCLSILNCENLIVLPQMWNITAVILVLI